MSIPVETIELVRASVAAQGLSPTVDPSTLDRLAVLMNTAEREIGGRDDR